VNDRLIDVARIADDTEIYRLLGVDVDFDDATAAGLTCGGHVDVLVQRLNDVPTQLWDAIACGHPAALVTRRPRQDPGRAARLSGGRHPRELRARHTRRGRS
jgi:xanthine/CO dehydrogenase XdhC/CoxF family maturation factor